MKRGFGSDNHSGVHNTILDAIINANEDHCCAYGDDPWTERATARIKELTEHMKANPKDFHSGRGLQKLVGQRRGLLAYLKKTDIERYRSLIARLGLRK